MLVNQLQFLTVGAVWMQMFGSLLSCKGGSGSLQVPLLAHAASHMPNAAAWPHQHCSTSLPLCMRITSALPNTPQIHAIVYPTLALLRVDGWWGGILTLCGECWLRSLRWHQRALPPRLMQQWAVPAA